MVKVTRKEWLFRFRQGESTVDGDDDGRADDDDGDAVDNVAAVELGRVLGLPPVETVDNGCGGGRGGLRRCCRGCTMRHVLITASSIIVYECGLLFSLHERAI